LAYAFSTLPEAVDILIVELNKTQTNAEHTKKQPTIQSGSNRQVPNSGFGSSRQMLNSDFKNWWEPRRLHDGASAAGSPHEAHVVEGGQIEMHFRKGLPFRLTHPLVAKMLKNYLIEVEDDATEALGPLRITSFFLDENVSRDLSSLRVVSGHGAGVELSRFSPTNAVIFLAMACVTALMASRFTPWHVKVAHHYRAYQSSNSDDSALE